MIKVIKRKVLETIHAEPAKRLRSNRGNTEATVNEWIEERRRNQIVSDAASRKTIARWTAITDI